MGKTDVISGRGKMLIVPRGFQPTMINIFICGTSAFLMRSFCHQVPKFWCDKDVSNILKFFFLIARLFKIEKFFCVSLKLKLFCWIELFFLELPLFCVFYLIINYLVIGWTFEYTQKTENSFWKLIIFFILFYSENFINKDNQLTIIL